MGGAEFRKEARQQVRGYGGKYAEAEGAAYIAALFCHYVPDAIGSKERFTGFCHDFLPQRGGADGVGGTLENLRAQFCFEFLHHCAKRGLRHAALIGSAPEVLASIHGKHVFKLL